MTMLAQMPYDRLDAGPRASAVERRCAATGIVRPVDEMIRFVVGPDGAAVPDVKLRLPGRGVWITATRAALRKAIERKAFGRSFKRDVRVGPELLQSTERLLERAALDAVAIAYKAGRVAVGFAKTEAALLHGDAVAVLHAADAAPDGVRKLNSALRRNASDRKAVAVLSAFTSAQLDLALGRSNVVHAALLGGPESKAVLARVARLERFCTGTDGMAEKRERNG